MCAEKSGFTSNTFILFWPKEKKKSRGDENLPNIHL